MNSFPNPPHPDDAADFAVDDEALRAAHRFLASREGKEWKGPIKEQFLANWKEPTPETAQRSGVVTSSTTTLLTLPSMMRLFARPTDSSPVERERNGKERNGRELSQALDQLPPRQRRAIELRYLQEPPCSLKQIARELGCTEKAAAALLCNALKTLRQLLRESQ